MKRQSPTTNPAAPVRPADSRPRRGGTKFDRLLADLLAARTRYEAARSSGSDRLETVAWQSRLHDLRHRIVRERQIQQGMGIQRLARPPV